MIGDEDTDASMGYFSRDFSIGVEVFELVVSFILKKIFHVSQRENIGLNQKDSLSLTKEMPGTELLQKERKH